MISSKLRVARPLFLVARVTPVLVAVAMVISLYGQTSMQTLPTRHVPELVRSGRAVLVGSLPGTQRLNLALTLTPPDQTALSAFLRNVYDPGNPSYHKFLTVEEFADQFAPTEPDYAAVLQFLSNNGMTVTKTTRNRLVVDVSASATAVASAFHLVLNMYQDSATNRRFFSPDREPSISATLPLWHIGGLDNAAVPKPLYIKGKAQSENVNTTGSGPSGNFLGSDRRSAYTGNPSFTGNGQTVALFELDGYSLSDVQAYFNNLGQSLSVPINNVLIDGGTAGSDGDDTEQAIDIIEAASLAPGLAGIDVYIAPEAAFQSGVQDTDIFEAMATADPLPYSDKRFMGLETRRSE